MNWLDIAIAVVVVFSAIRGASQGVLRSALGLVAVLAALGVAGHTYLLGAARLHHVLGVSDRGAEWVAFFLIYAVVQAVASIAVGLLGWSARASHEGTIGRVAGAMLDAYRAAILAAVLVGTLLALPRSLQSRFPPTGPVAREVMIIAAPMLHQLVPLLPGTAGNFVRATPSPGGASTPIPAARFSSARGPTISPLVG